MSDNNKTDNEIDCKTRALARLRLAEHRFPFVKVIDEVSVPYECHIQAGNQIGAFKATRSAFRNHIYAAWQATLHEGIYLSDASGIQVFLERDGLACIVTGATSFSSASAYKPTQYTNGSPRDSDGDCPLTRCARINGDAVVGEALLKHRASRRSGDFLRNNARGDTVLHVCARFKRREFAQLVVQYAGHYNFWVPNHGGKTSVDYGIMRFMTSELMMGPSVHEQNHPSEYSSRTFRQCVKFHGCRYCAGRLSREDRHSLIDWVVSTKDQANWADEVVENLLDALKFPCVPCTD